MFCCKMKGTLTIGPAHRSRHLLSYTGCERAYRQEISGLPPVTTVPIEWVPLGDLAVPPALAEIENTTPTSPVHEVPLPDVPLAPQIPVKVIYVRPDSQSALPTVTPKHLGASVPLRVPTGLRSVLICRSAHRPPDIHCRWMTQMPPAVVTIVPPVRYAVLPIAPEQGELGTTTPFAQSQRTEHDPMVPLIEFGGVRLDLEEVIRGIKALGGVIRPLISDSEKNIRGRE